VEGSISPLHFISLSTNIHVSALFYHFCDLKKEKEKLTLPRGYQLLIDLCSKNVGHFKASSLLSFEAIAFHVQVSKQGLAWSPCYIKLILNRQPVCVAETAGEAEAAVHEEREGEVDPHRRSYFCPHCDKQLHLSTTEILRHKKTHSAPS